MYNNGQQLQLMQQNVALNGTKRLSRQQDWKRPETTATEAINQDEAQMLSKLENYVEVDNIDYVTINTHVRYVVFDTRVGKYLFRLGGLLAMKHPTYVVLSNGKQSWSVPKETEFEKQTKTTRFFRILNPFEMQQKRLEEEKKGKDEVSMVAQQQMEELERKKAEIDQLKQVIAKLSGGGGGHGNKKR
jgi:hypothetical protein